MAENCHCREIRNALRIAKGNGISCTDSGSFVSDILRHELWAKAAILTMAESEEEAPHGEQRRVDALPHPLQRSAIPTFSVFRLTSEFSKDN